MSVCRNALLDEVMAAAIEKANEKKMHYLAYLTISIEILLQICIRSIFTKEKQSEYEIRPHDIFFMVEKKTNKREL